MSNKDDDLRPEYPEDLIKSGARGKYAKRYREEGTKLDSLTQICESISLIQPQ